MSQVINWLIANDKNDPSIAEILTSSNTTWDFIIIFDVSLIFFHKYSSSSSFDKLLRTRFFTFTFLEFYHCLLLNLVIHFITMILWWHIGVLFYYLIYHHLVLNHFQLLSFVLLNILAKSLISCFVRTPLTVRTWLHPLLILCLVSRCICTWFLGSIYSLCNRVCLSCWIQPIGLWSWQISRLSLFTFRYIISCIHFNC